MLQQVDNLTALSTGTPNGVTSKLKWLGCPKKVGWLHENYQQESHNEALLFGTFMHKMLEHYYGGETVTDGAKYVFSQLDKASTLRALALKAENVMRIYSVSHEPDEFKIRMVEQYFEIEDFMGTGPLTGRWDLVVEAKEYVPGTMPLVEGATYILDHKTTKNVTSNWEMQFNYSLQLWTYMLAYEAYTGETPAGCIVNLIGSGTRMPTFHRTLVPFPTLAQRAFLRNTLEYVLEVQKQEPLRAIPTWDNCFKRGACPVLEAGQCFKEDV